MLLRMATGTMVGMAVATAATATLALGAGAIGAALLARRLCEERRGWKKDADEAVDAPIDVADEPGPEAPAA
ncbi:hypothetical protein [Falsiroseomonas stagni]|uniref:Uncharacterized protein n=1 Tax=Falsiroseomonas stagni DSM 19981 TaxID=1123062 RepID=A0A1I4CEA0_9PROT|nr:hypothetical protein [Falsiroseomonas stagni]SFK79528.1 hypothetical protein SAMN02745775_107187 [Falsiroseomonas stagni DSM 19981]